jgi:hypothetical protein
MDAERKERMVRNEKAFRKVNEAIEAGREPADPGELIVFICECGALGCNELVELSARDYEDVRSDPAGFVLVPGHEEPEIERVVARHDGFIVVHKI